jgi:polysaccharide pyruvyl transferase WcaK-like protein
LLDPVASQECAEVVETGLTGRTRIGVVVRPWPYRVSPQSKRVYRQHIDAIAGAADELITRLDCDIYIVAQALGIGPTEDDRLAIADLLERIRHRHLCHIIQEDLPPQVLACLYGQMDLLITARLHAAIFAACAGTPSVGIDYPGGSKLRGVLEEIRMSHYVLAFESAGATNIVDKVEELLLERQSLPVRERVEALRARINPLGELVDNAVEGPA